MNYQLMMRKEDFMVVPFSEAAIMAGTHIGITLDQYRFLCKNPDKNGPKIFHFNVIADGMKDGEKDSAFIELLRKEQDKQDKGGEAYVPPVETVKDAEEKPLETPVEEVKGEFTEEAKNASITLETYLNSVTDKNDLIAYAKTTLGVVIKTDARYGIDKIRAAILEAVEKKAEASQQA